MANFRFRFPLIRRDRTPDMPVIAKTDSHEVRPGIRFYTSREELDQATGSIGERLETVGSADMLLVLGVGFVRGRGGLDKVKRMILPDPTSRAFKDYLQSRELIREVNQVAWAGEQARKAGIEVKVAKHFIWKSIIFADVEQDHGWIHVENVLPHVSGENAVSYTIYRRENRKCVDHYVAMFTQLWNEGTPFDDWKKAKS
jgi:hypothetical protein